MSDEKKGSRALTIAIEAAILVVAVFIGLAVRYGVYYTAIVTSSSMEPTLLVNDRMLVDHRASLSGRWKRGDTVLFREPQSWNKDGGASQDDGTELVKRVIGLPGETVEIGANRVLVNGQPIGEPYVKEAWNADVLQVTLAPGQYFVMGDNRNNSDDSRANGPVYKDDIIGRAVRLLGPISRMGALKRPDY